MTNTILIVLSFQGRAYTSQAAVQALVLYGLAAGHPCDSTRLLESLANLSLATRKNPLQKPPCPAHTMKTCPLFLVISWCGAELMC